MTAPALEATRAFGLVARLKGDTIRVPNGPKTTTLRTPWTIM